MAGEAFAFFLLQNLLFRRHETRAAQGVPRAFAADSLQKQQIAIRTGKKVASRALRKFESSQHPIFALVAPPARL
jgi:hypothetical protein